MPSLTALLHTRNDALRLGRALETLYACDQIVIVDHDSQDASVQIARQYGARVVSAESNLREYITDGYLLCLTPYESVSESLATSLFELKLNPERLHTYSVFLREETAHGWIDHAFPQTRIVANTWPDWAGNVPAGDPASIPLEGELLRFAFP
jgi:(heptosyl)LPS beta-1,4-glucosyltransferase